MQTMPKQNLDFAKVEALRKHMLLTTQDMSSLLGVSRMTYYGWVRGKPVRNTNIEYVKGMLKKLLAIMTDYQWPQPEVIVMEQKQRKQRLVELLEQYQ
jgi:DNA-binding XRE family transcriptional regulator